MTWYLPGRGDCFYGFHRKRRIENRKTKEPIFWVKSVTAYCCCRGCPLPVTQHNRIHQISTGRFEGRCRIIHEQYILP